MTTAHAVTIAAHVTPFARRNGLPGSIDARCACGWSTTTLFEDSAGRAAANHLEREARLDRIAEVYPAAAAEARRS